MKRYQHFVLTKIALAVFAIATAVNSSAADKNNGEIFATDNCARCHAINKTGASPNAKAPPFWQIAGKYELEFLQEALAEGIVTGHNNMPEFILTTKQIDDLLAHFQTLK